MKDLIDYWRNEWKQVTDLSHLNPVGTGSGDLLDYWRNEWRQATDMSWMNSTGEKWEDREDKETANRLILTAEKQLKSYEKLQKNIQNRIVKGQGDAEYIKNSKETIEDFKERITLLKEGIDGIKQMGNDKETKYHFAKNSTSENGYVQKRSDGVIDLFGAYDETFWHESVHMSDYINKRFDSRFDRDGILKTTPYNEHIDSEIRAYRSQYSFISSKSSLPFLKTVEKVSQIDKVFIETFTKPK